MSELSRSLYRAGEGEPLLLLHGFTGTWRHWRPVLADLVPRFEVIAPTLAGHDGGPAFPDEGTPLARTSSGTMTLSEDRRGLRFAAQLEPTDPDVQRIVPKLRRGDMSESSFAFRAVRQEWSKDKTRRELREVSIHRGISRSSATPPTRTRR
jgi:prohead serine protease